MKTRRVSVAEGKKSFTQLLREAEEAREAVLVYRHDEFAGAIVPPELYWRWQRLDAYGEALRISGKLAGLPINAFGIAAESRRELEERT